MADPADEEALARERTRLRQSCRQLAGAAPVHPAERFEAIAAWLRAHGEGDGDGDGDGEGDPADFVQPDVYGSGALVEDFESEVAALFGMEAARFMPSGCMAQPIALRIWSDRAGNPNTAFHATSHLELHEEHGYRELHGLNAYLLGDPDRPTSTADLAALLAGPAKDSGLASLLIELPAREIGGQLPPWDDLVALTGLARENGISLHCDGARIWQVAPAYGRSHAEIAASFDSLYVSFYKDVGALPGAMLLGPRDFIDEAAVWQRRQGGTLYTAMANVISARMLLPGCLERMPRLVERAREVAALFAAQPRASVLPDPPQTSMFHLTLQGEVDALLQARDRVARAMGVWLFGNLRPVDGRTAGKTELSMGPASLELSDAELAAAISLLLED